MYNVTSVCNTDSFQEEKTGTTFLSTVQLVVSQLDSLSELVPVLKEIGKIEQKCVHVGGMDGTRWNGMDGCHRRQTWTTVRL